mmetsp:Transcript_109263/g.308238  ORF Transcript_109263/g.308238 Transcript_109263/m.308238 type:complete len:234 (-) Transcript_109263:3183-3884(-)
MIGGTYVMACVDQHAAIRFASCTPRWMSASVLARGVWHVWPDGVIGCGSGAATNDWDLLLELIAALWPFGNTSYLMSSCSWTSATECALPPNWRCCARAVSSAAAMAAKSKRGPFLTAGSPPLLLGAEACPKLGRELKDTFDTTFGDLTIAGSTEPTLVGDKLLPLETAAPAWMGDAASPRVPPADANSDGNSDQESWPRSSMRSASTSNNAVRGALAGSAAAARSAYRRFLK